MFCIPVLLIPHSVTGPFNPDIIQYESRKTNPWPDYNKNTFRRGATERVRETGEVRNSPEFSGFQVQGS